MRPIRLITILLLLSNFANAQDDWKHSAKEYLSIVQSKDAYTRRYEAIGKLKKTISIVEKEFGSVKQNKYLLHLLSLWSVEYSLGKYDEYLTTSLQSYSKDTINQALLLIEFAKRSIYEEQAPFYKGLLNKANDLLTSPSHTNEVLLKIHLLNEYVLLGSDNDTPIELINHLKKALQEADQYLSIDHPLYQLTLKSLVNQLEQAGDLENANNYQLQYLPFNEVSAHDLKTELNKGVYPILNSDVLTAQQEEMLIIAQLFDAIESFENETSYFRDRIAIQLYEKLFYSLDSGLEQLKSGLAYLIGTKYLTIKHYDEAVKFLKISSLNYQNKNDQHKELLENSLIALGSAYFSQKEYLKAQETFNKIDFEISNDKRVDLLNNQILVAYKLNNKDLLNTLTNDHLDLIKNQESSLQESKSLMKFASLHAIVGNYEQSFNLNKRAYEGFVDNRRLEITYEREEMGEFSDINEDFILNVDTESSYIEIGGAIPEEDEYLVVLGELAKTGFLSGEYEEASGFLTDYVNLYYTNLHNLREIFSYDSVNYGSDLSEIYELKRSLFPKYDLFHNIIIKSSSSTNQIWRSKALQYAYNRIIDSKANIQLEFRHMQKSILASTDSTIISAYKLYLEKREEYIIAQQEDPQELEYLKSDLDQIKLTLSSYSAQFKPVEKQFTYWKDIQSVLKKGEAALEIKRVEELQGDSVYYLFYLITPKTTSPELVVLNNGVSMEKRSLPAYKNAIKYKVKDLDSYASFWESISSKLHGVKTLYLSPDGLFHQINVNTLFDENNNQYVGDQLKIVQVVSTKSLLKPKKKSKKNKKALLIGRPDYDLDAFNTDPNKSKNSIGQERALSREQITQGEIADLPGTELEIRNIENVLKKSNISRRVFLNKDSKEEHFKASADDIIHIATHGFWFEEHTDSNADAMFQSGLLLAGVKNYASSTHATSNDGLLTAYEIQGMNLEKTELVVLSACETGLGKMSVGEGVYGLQRAFHIAGVDKLIMSLWKVDDVATQELFSLFYKYWLQENNDILKAFSRAQNTLRKKYKDPFYWGAFVLVD